MNANKYLIKICPELIFNSFEPYLERSEESFGRSRLSAEDYKKGKVKINANF